MQRCGVADVSGKADAPKVSSPLRFMPKLRCVFLSCVLILIAGERVGRNPKTGEEKVISPRRVLVFRASNIMKNKINRGLVRREAAE